MRDGVPRRLEEVLGAARVGHADPGAGHLLAEQVLHPARGEQPTVTHDGDRVAQLLHLGQDVRAQQHGHTRLPEGADDLPDPADAGWVESVGRLVEDEQVGVLEQRSGDGQPLLHPGGVAPVVVAGTVGEPDLLERGVDRGARHADGPREQAEVLATGERREEAGFLDDGPDAVDDLWQLGRHLEPEEPHRALGRAGQPEQHLDRAGLAGTVRAQEPVHPARSDVEVETVDCHHTSRA